MISEEKLWLALVREILGNMCIVIVSNEVVIISFEINVIFLIKPFLPHDQTSRT